MAAALRDRGQEDLLLVDELDTTEKWKNLRQLRFSDYIDKSALPEVMGQSREIEAVIHLGACSSTTEKNATYLMENNYRYTLDLARSCLERGIRFVYASSAATYGDGQRGYEDDEDQLERLLPLNMYGYSKHLFDLKARREGFLRDIAGLKFFNVYGPNEYHKGDMASVVYKAFQQIQNVGKVKLFRSYHPDYADGGQLRDFVYVKDVVAQTLFLLDHPGVNGIFNSGTGVARSFAELVRATFSACGKAPNIEYIEMPEVLQDRYQYYTCASMDKARKAGLNHRFATLEEGVDDYVKNFLSKGEATW